MTDKVEEKEDRPDPGYVFMVYPDAAHDCMTLASLGSVTPPLAIGKRTRFLFYLIHAQK